MDKNNLKETLKDIIREELSKLQTPKEDVTTQLKKELGKFGAGEFQVKLIDKRPGHSDKTVTMKLDGKGDVSTTKIDESLKDKLMIGIVCTIMASGMVSCTKPGNGFGYNLDYTPIEYNPTKGTPNKTIDFLTPQGVKSVKVDSTLSKIGSSGSSGIYVKTQPTDAEIIVLKYGALINREQSYNNGNGTNPSTYMIQVPFNKITLDKGDGNLYKTSGEADMEIRDYGYFKQGLEAMKNDPDRFKKETGLDASSILSKL